MEPRVSLVIADTIRKLLRRGWPQRSIARYFNISTTTVSRIAFGTWRPVDQEDDPFWELKRRAKRCSGCGGLVYQWPCLTCEMRAKAERELGERQAMQMRRSA